MIFISSSNSKQAVKYTLVTTTTTAEPGRIHLRRIVAPPGNSHASIVIFWCKHCSLLGICYALVQRFPLRMPALSFQRSFGCPLQPLHSAILKTQMTNPQLTLRKRLSSKSQLGSGSQAKQVYLVKGVGKAVHFRASQR